ncbi:MAG: hypothetical protein WCO93_09340 [bacterium]
MKKVTESTQAITPEAIINQVPDLDIPMFRSALREMMDGYFLHCAGHGTNPEPAWCAFRAVDGLLGTIHDFKQAPGEQRKAVGM